MAFINNNAKITFPVIVTIRELLEHRALWLYFIYDEAIKKGIDISTLAETGINKCGIYQGKDLLKNGKTDSLKGLKRNLFGVFARKVFEMKIVKSSDDELEINFHYCPLVKAWQKQNCDDETIGKLCDIAMCGDRGIAESYNSRLEIKKTLSHKDEYCEIRFVKESGKIT